MPRSAPHLLGLLALCCLLCAGCGLGIGGSHHAAGDATTPSTVDAGPNRFGAAAVDFDNPRPEAVLFLDGAASTGASFSWSVLDQTAPGRTMLTSPLTKVTGFYAEAAGVYTVQLAVDDGNGHVATDTVSVTLIQDADFDGLADGDDVDPDGDSFIGMDDAFPSDRASHGDFDGNGTGNYYELDVDGDGTPDIQDDFPLDPTRTAYDIYTESSEPSSSNANDGTSVSEPAGTLPKRIEGAVSATDGRPDIDFFRVTFTATGRYSAVLKGGSPTMQPTISILRPDGTAPVDATAANLATGPGSTAVSVFIGTADDHFLIVTDASGTSDPSFTYTVLIFPDEDLDGVPDDLEMALDMNHHTADSDGDGLPDLLELNAVRGDFAHLVDLDGDGLPVWWDSDSDGDWILDGTEHVLAEDRPNLDAVSLALRNDADQDGIPNFLDPDSDGNGISDREEAGENLQDPVDTDFDGAEDFLDSDDDDDGLLDVNDPGPDRLIPLERSQYGGSPDYLRLQEAFDVDLDVRGVARPGDTLRLRGYGFPSVVEDAWVVMRGRDGSLNVHPDASSNLEMTCTWPMTAGGLFEVYVVTGGLKSNSVPVLRPAPGAPILTAAAVDAAASEVTFIGFNLDASLQVHLSGATVPYDNSAGDPASFTVGYPSTAVRGGAYVSSSAGDSNFIPVALAVEIPGQVVLPAGSSVDVTTLDVSWGPQGTDLTPESDGSFVTTGGLGTPTTVTALIERASSTESAPAYALFLEAIRLPGDTSVTVDSGSTALALVWNIIGVPSLAEASAWRASRDVIAGVAEVQALGAHLETALAADPELLVSPPAATQTKIDDAVSAASAALAASLTKPSAALRTSGSTKASEATVTPTEVDDISVYERPGTGNVTVENDSLLYLSAEIRLKNGTVVQEHISGVRGMAGPQGYGLLYWASTQDFKVPNGRDCTVQVITPGVDMEYAPQVAPPNKQAYYWVAVRTVLERIVWPPLADLLGGKIDKNLLNDVVMSQVLSYPAILDSLVHGQVKDFSKGILQLLYSDFASAGPITKALAKEYGKGIGNKILEKVAEKIGAKFVPIVGEIDLALDIASAANDTLNATKTITDMATTDSVIEFDVDFPLELDRVLPGKVLPDGTTTDFIVEGSGFGPITEGIGPFAQTFRPSVQIRDADGYTNDAYVVHISPDGERMLIRVSGSILHKDVKGPLEVIVHHPITGGSNALVKLEDAIEIVDSIEISSIDPAKGPAGKGARIYGAGFKETLADNEVQVGGVTALLSASTRTQISLVIPGSLDPGTYPVRARARTDGTWGDWSNTVDYEVVAGDIHITVSDNGGAKDDAFSLFVDNVFIGTMYAVSGNYSSTYKLTLAPGPHTARLLGVEAPDSIGTYSISFSGVTNVTGQLSGTDLVPGVQKYYTFDVPDPSASSKPTPAPAALRGMAAPKPRMPDPEAPRGDAGGR